MTTKPRPRAFTTSGLDAEIAQGARILAATKATTLRDVVEQALQYAVQHPHIIKGGKPL